MDQLIRLKEWRTYRGLSQVKLSERSGVTRTTIISIEHQRQLSPRTGTMVSLAAALGVKPYELVSAPPDVHQNAVMAADRSRPMS